VWLGVARVGTARNTEKRQCGMARVHDTAAVDALHRAALAGSEKWQMGVAGFSGGSKGVGYVAPFLARNGCRITRNLHDRRE